MAAFDIWVVETKKLYTGNRLEGYDITFNMVTDHEQSLAFAWDEMQKYQEFARLPKDEHQEYNEEGDYKIGGSGGYDDWPEFEITTFKKQFDPNGEVSLSFSTRG